MDAKLTDKQRLSAAYMAAERRFPYFVSGFANMARFLAPGVGTMAITSKGAIVIDPAYLLEHSAPECAESIAHELLHWLRKHFARGQAMKARCGASWDAYRWNVAADCEINDDLNVSMFPGWELPQNHGLKPGRSAEEYYMALSQQAEQPDDKGDGDGSGSDSPAQDGASKPGSAPDAKPEPNAPQTRSQSAKDDAPKADVGRGRCGSGSGGDPVQGEDVAAGCRERSTAEAEAIRQEVARSIVEHGRRAGTVPGGLGRWAQGQLAPPQVRWQDTIARLARRGVADVAGRMDYSRRHIGRRQAGVDACVKKLGGAPAILPTLRAPRPRVAVGIDTSGSMSTAQLMLALGEVSGVLRSLGTSVTFLACDARVQVAKQVKTVTELRNNLRGGGGTDFRPIFKAVEELRPKVDLFIFATDGFGPAPAQAPASFRTIWLLVGKGAKAPCSWGKHVTVET